MDNRKRKLLQFHQKDIVQDLDPTYIIDDLYTNDAISNDEFDRIFVITDRAERTRYLLSVIQNGNNRSFQVFVDSLAKDYEWLYEKFNTADMKNSTVDESFEDSLSRGDVPRLPVYYVQRTKLEDEVAAKLSVLTRHKTLVLHGMSGCGKTSVVIGALRHNSNLVIENFDGVVFWLNLANVKTDDDIVALQVKLYRKAAQYRRQEGSFMNSSISMSSIGSNTDSQSLTSSEWSWQDLRDTLKTSFQENSLKEALLILDEVNEKKTVEAFDIGCKILITTRDTDVVANLQPQIIKVHSNFEEAESLQLFASCLDIPPSQLPRQAKQLHNICKGSPFHIALIGAQLAENRERLVHDNKRWDYYIDKLKKKDFRSLLKRSTDQCDPMKPIEICINSLDQPILVLFKMLAVLPDNVKISAKVLSVIWNKRINEVESIMKKLRSKSLINECFVQEQKNYIYEIHDLIMNYLRSDLKVDQINKLHVEVLRNYGYRDLETLPIELADDGYIAFYIGYHLDHAKKDEKSLFFNKLFMNLKFLGSKVRLTGPADVMMDFQKYGNVICHDKIDEELFRSINEYLSTHGNDLYRYPYTDIVQSILQYVSKGPLYHKAYQYAQDGCSKGQLYFDFLHEPNVDDTVKPINIDVKQTITSVCFMYDYVVVGTQSGVIKIFYVYTNKLKKELTNSIYPIKHVSACPVNPLRVAALNSEGVLHLWYLDDLDPDFCDNAIGEESEKNSSEPDENEYEMLYTDSHVTITPKIGPIINFAWANNEETLITHTSKIIILYGPDAKPTDVLDIFDRDINIICCLLSNDNNNVIVGYSLNNTYYVDVIQLLSKGKVVTYEQTGPIRDILCVPGSVDKILVINDTEVNGYEWTAPHPYTVNNYNTYKSEKIISNKEIKENVKFIAAVVNKSGSLLFVSTDDSRIVCVDLVTNSSFYLDNRRGNVYSMAVSEMLADEFVPGSDVLLSGTGTVENSAKVWYLDNAYISQATQKHRKVRLTSKFDVSFVNALTPKTSTGAETPPALQNANVTPKRHQSFKTSKELEKRSVKITTSLDRHVLKPLNLKGISNGNDESGIQPLLAVVDDKNNIQIMRGRKVLTEIAVRPDDEITAVKISPCNQYIVYGLQSGTVKQFAIRTKETKVIMDIYSRIQYLQYVTPNLLVVSGKNRCMMAYRFTFEGEWKPEMLQKGNCCLGSQEILNDIQGNKKKTSQSGSLSSAGSDASISSKERLFPSDSKGPLNKGSSLVQCFWVEGIGMISIENNATIKLWDQQLKLVTVLYGRQTGVYVKCAAFQKNILVICDDYGKFQIFELTSSTPPSGSQSILLHTIQEYKLNNKIVSCDLTKDGNILAMGLDSGSVVVWNIPTKTQLTYLKHHKTQVLGCLFSPVPDRLYRSGSTVQSPTVNHNFHYPNHHNANDATEDEQPPLVLVTMASEIVWWNISYLLKIRANKRYLRPRGRNVLTPLTSPVESRTELTGPFENLNLNSTNNYFFGNGYVNMYDSWEGLWRRKTYKEGSKKKEILACIKLSGMNAKTLYVDDKFSCFVTVDNPGHIHIMNVMKADLTPS